MGKKIDLGYNEGTSVFLEKSFNGGTKNPFKVIYRVRKGTSLIKCINPSFKFSKPQRGSYFFLRK
jgi:hypothetical protein